jgi:hypothetical protein
MPMPTGCTSAACPWPEPVFQEIAAPPSSRDGTAKIGDVGMAKIMNRDYVTGVVSTLAW